MKYSFPLTASLCPLLFLAEYSKNKKSNCETINSTAIIVNSDATHRSSTAAKKYYITRTTWKFNAAKVGSLDASAFLQTSQKDNLVTFAAAGTDTKEEGATKCTPGDPQTSPFIWNFLSSEPQLFISSTLFAVDNNTFTILTLSSTPSILSQTITLSGIPQNVEITFTH